ncbi:modulator of drug activity B [Natronobacillus azotifigens]|uniref:NAD(P)H-dependent oxidoreductase n=1 Tax=Natronobacillus azotifigens TaxID=472978 RepID=A0A9J6RFF2_9BACI|nr:NAD(P)H-dependent oxidoreductase [Natronobacillus azotifigens]MCZ0704352.1 NAD(P)H-dependent oxidoreductase [Natronobacillus azotifigens]
MKNIFIINGHQAYPNSPGDLNRTIFDEMVKKLATKYHVQTTIVDEGYLLDEEREKFQWADYIIYQTPIFWFSIPGKFKTYFDQVYKSGIFFKGDKGYGQGGLFIDKRYMFSTTWNAPEDQFSTHAGFFQGKNVDEALFHLHRTQAFLGMKPFKTFSVHNVVKKPEVDKYLVDLDKHLEEIFF